MPNAKMFHENSPMLLLWCLSITPLTDSRDYTNDQTSAESRYSRRSAENGAAKYPKDDQVIRAHATRFQEYSLCLNASKMTPEAHYALPGTSISLDCKVCASPKGNLIQWKYANKATSWVEKVVQLDGTVNRHSETPRATPANDGLQLHLFGVTSEDSGSYTCYQFGDVITPHLVQVGNSKEKLAKVKPPTASKGPYASPPLNLTDIGVRVWFRWSDWSICSRCDRIGKRIRFGICMVTSFEVNNRSDARILQEFPGGIPCRSNLLPKTYQDHPKIKSMLNEYMVGFCKEGCPKNKKYVLKETGGVLLNKMANTKDPYTRIKQLPQLPPPIQHSALFFHQWDSAVIPCPGTDHNNAPVHWRLGLNLVLSENERVHLTATHILVIENLVISDSNVYTCWQRNHLVGIVRLTVSQPIRISFEEQLNAVVLLTIMLSFTIISMRILRVYMKRRRLEAERQRNGKNAE